MIPNEQGREQWDGKLLIGGETLKELPYSAAMPPGCEQEAASCQDSCSGHHEDYQNLA